MAKYEVTLADGKKETVESERIDSFDNLFLYFYNGDTYYTGVVEMYPVADVKNVKRTVEIPVEETPTKKPRKKRNLTDEARKAISDAQKARWAAKKSEKEEE